jgi:hypothetical protein
VIWIHVAVHVGIVVDWAWRNAVAQYAPKAMAPTANTPVTARRAFFLFIVGTFSAFHCRLCVGVVEDSLEEPFEGLHFGLAEALEEVVGEPYRLGERLGIELLPSGVSSSLMARRSSSLRTRRTRPRFSSASILRVMAPGSWARTEQMEEAVSLPVATISRTT